MQSTRNLLNEFLGEIRSNRKLQYGLLAILLLACGEWGLGWSDTLSAREKQLQQLRGELHALRNQSRDEHALRRQLRDLELAQKSVDERLWRVSSDAVGQARLKDWLTELLKKAGAKNPNLVLSSPRALGGRDGSGQLESQVAAATNLDGMTPASAATAEKERAQSLREVRANVTLVFTPATLEQILLDIEGGEPMATVESLNVSKRDRKIDMTVRVLMRIVQPDATEIKDKALDSKKPSEVPG